MSFSHHTIIIDMSRSPGPSTGIKKRAASKRTKAKKDDAGSGSAAAEKGKGAKKEKTYIKNMVRDNAASGDKS